MIVEDIKNQYSMADIANLYGFTPNRSDFIKCPFHSGDRTASLKIYKDSFHCFGCGANGDIFKFVQLMDDCDFKTAFYKLGGTYKKDKTFSDLRKLDKAKRDSKKKKEQKNEFVARLKTINKLINELEFNLKYLQEGCEDWHKTTDDLAQAYDIHERLLKEVITNGYFNT